MADYKQRARETPRSSRRWIEYVYKYCIVKELHDYGVAEYMKLSDKIARSLRMQLNAAMDHLAFRLAWETISDYCLTGGANVKIRQLEAPDPNEEWQSFADWM